MATRALTTLTRNGRLPNDVYQQRLCALQYCGSDLGTREFEMRSDRPYEFRFSQKQIELNILASVLTTAGYVGADIWPSERPDFRVNSASTKSVFVEVAEVVDPASARYHNTIMDLKFQVMQDVYEHPVRRGRMKERFLSFQLADVPRKRVLHQYRNDIVRFVADADLDSLPCDALVPVPAGYTALHADSVTFFHRRGLATAVDVTSTAHSFNPKDLALNTLKILNRKRAKAAEYEGSPLWLVLGMTDWSSWPAASLDILTGWAFEIAPFDKVIVGDQNGVVEYAR